MHTNLERHVNVTDTHIHTKGTNATLHGNARFTWHHSLGATLSSAEYYIPNITESIHFCITLYS